MPRISERAQQMPSSPIRKLTPFALAAKERGIKVYHLNIGQPDIESPKTALDELKKIDKKVLAYSLSQGIIEYRTELNNYYHRLGFTDLTTDNFLVTTGGSEALDFSLAVLCDAGDEVIVSEPYYANYNGFASQFGIKVKAVTAKIENGFALPDIEEFEKQVTAKTRAIIINNPSNPTGYVYTKDELKKIADIAIKHDLVVISDEVYREYAYDGEHPTSVLAFPELKNNCIVIDSESKRYSMCGIRCGFMVTRSHKMYEMAMKFAQARLSPPLIAQIIAAEAHKNDGEYIHKVHEEYAHRRDVLVEALQQIPGVICAKPKGAFYVIAELPVDDTEKFARWLLEKYENNGETVMVAPAGGFYSDPELGKKQIRMAYVIKEADLRRCAELIKDALVKYNK